MPSKTKSDSEIEFGDIKKAWIPAKNMREVEGDRDCLIDNECFIKKSVFSGCVFPATTVAGDCELEQCIFQTCSLDGVRISGFFRNLRFESCSTVNSRFERVRMTRTEFNTCKLLGASFQYCSGSDVTFVGCNCEFADFSQLKLKRLAFKDCILREANFQYANLGRVIFDNCDLRKAEFSFSKLAEANFCGSRIEGIRVDAENLRGIIVDYHQAAYLGTRFLGLDIR